MKRKLKNMETGTLLKDQCFQNSVLFDSLGNLKMHFMLLNLSQFRNGGLESLVSIGESEQCVTPCGQLFPLIIDSTFTEKEVGWEKTFLIGLQRLENFRGMNP